MSVLSELQKIEAELASEFPKIESQLTADANALTALQLKDTEIEVKLDAILAAIAKLTAAISGPDIVGAEIVVGDPTTKPPVTIPVFFK